MKININDIPNGYKVCQQSHCNLALSCLRQLAYTTEAERSEWLTVTNPQRCKTAAEESADCPYFMNAQPVKFAFGFIGMEKKMFPDQHNAFKKTLMARHGRNPYYEMRNGSRPIPPKEQRYIMLLLQQLECIDGLDFDRYEKEVQWY